MMEKLADRIAALSPQQRALFDLRLRKMQIEAESTRPAAAESTVDRVGHAAATESPEADVRPSQQLEFSMFFFSGDGATTAANKYDLLLKCARYADEQGFAAIWTPERHFKPFGGLYPNPSVIAAALAMVTQRVQLRAGSVVLPLHNPLRVVEEWAVVDNLSGGRVGVAFASGWLADDFVLDPDSYQSRKAQMFENIETVRKLWTGDSIMLKNGKAEEVAIRTYPNTLQRELPIWITALHLDTFIQAGQIGANVLTALIEQDLETCTRCIEAYRQARVDNGHDASKGRVTVMLHTYIGEDLEVVKRTVRDPLREYLRSFLRIAAVKEPPEAGQAKPRITPEDQEALLDLAFERYFSSHALLGTSQSALRMVQRLRSIGVDEIACMLDFGLEADLILRGLLHLRELMQCAGATARSGRRG